jgi:hypothetical protein
VDGTGRAKGADCRSVPRIAITTTASELQNSAGELVRGFDDMK